MNATDIFFILHWWIILFLIGLGFLPITLFLFKSFFDKGYLFAKILGISIGSYLIFLFSILHVLPFSIISTFTLFIVAAIVLFFLTRKSLDILSLIKKHWKIFLVEELLFVIALFFWSYIHAFSPDIHGLEKYMDFGFINSMLRSEYLPPKDMWFTPFPINYYYFGHFMTAVLTKLSGIPSSITFNLMLSTIFAFCFTQSFSIAANLYASLKIKTPFKPFKIFIAGLLSSLLVTLAGNLHIIYAFFKAYPNENPVPLWQLLFLPFQFPNGYWYPNATRFIHNTIHEFPIYSWTVADLHGHVLDIPIVLLLVALLFSLFLKTQEKNQQDTKTKVSEKKQKTKNSSFSFFTIIHSLENKSFIVIFGFLLAIAYMTNAWDGGIYLLLTILIFTFIFWQKKFEYKKLLLSLVSIILVFSFFVFPYNFHFKPFVSGIGILCSPTVLTNIGKIGPFLFEADHCQHSPWWQLITLYGFFYFFIISFAIFLFKKKQSTTADKFVLLLIILGSFLILVPELVYVKDIYPAHYRANTMFKLVFQSFMLLSLASGYIIVRIISTSKKIISLLFLPFAAGLVGLVMLYPFQAIPSYYGTTYQSLNGTNYLKAIYPSDYAAIQWLNKNIKGQPVILEAQGDSYTDYARISVNTGLPTVLGWTVHEWLWRGTYDIPAPRIEEIKTMYESHNIAETKSLLEKYHVEYVFIGSLEREKYLDLYEYKFNVLGKPVYKKGTTTIFKL